MLESKEIMLAMQNKTPVVMDGEHRYAYITRYSVEWDSKRRQFVKRLQLMDYNQNAVVDVIADRVELDETEPELKGQTSMFDPITE